MNGKSATSNDGPGDENDVSPEDCFGHTPKAARTILVRDSVGLT